MRDFDLARLIGLNTIGCNQAFLHGAEICNIVVFGDLLFWLNYEKRLLNEYGGWVVSGYPNLVESGTPDQPPQWVHCFEREDRGLSRDKLAWNLNTGSLAINLALILGAKRVLLLGFDCSRSRDGKPHWHDEELRRFPQTDESYRKFQEGMQRIAGERPPVFPGREIVNVSDGTSKLTAFPILPMDQVFSKEGVLT